MLSREFLGRSRSTHKTVCFGTKGFERVVSRVSSSSRHYNVSARDTIVPQPSSSNGGRGQRRRQKQRDELRAACAERVQTVVPLGETMLDDIQGALDVRKAKERRNIKPT